MFPLSHLFADPFQAHHVVGQDFVGEVLRPLEVVILRLSEYLKGIDVSACQRRGKDEQSIHH